MDSDNKFLINLFGDENSLDSQLRASQGASQGQDALASSVIPEGGIQLNESASEEEGKEEEPKELNLKKANNWQFTFNKIEFYPKFERYLLGLKSINYLISCQEKAPTTGHVHIHCYAQFEKPFKPSIQKIQECKVHVEKCYGSPEQNVKYIKKEDEPEKRGFIIKEWGEIRLNKNKFPTIKEVKNMDKDERENLPLQYYNQIKKIGEAENNLIEIDSLQKDITVTYIWGPSGKGKSCLAKLMIKELGQKFNMVKHIGEFWHGVSEDCEIALYDDFREGDMTPREFINFVDYNIHNLNVKGGAIKNNYKYIFITSVLDPNHIYAQAKNIDETRVQWLRRIEVRDIKAYDTEAIVADYKAAFGEFKPRNLFNNLLNKYLKD